MAHFSAPGEGSAAGRLSFATEEGRELDFASWGGFAQNYAGRRIPFEHASSTQYWERTHAEHLFIPTFSKGPSGPYLPGTAIKGAFRTGVVHGRITDRIVTELGTRVESEGRMPRRPAISMEESALGNSGSDPLRVVSAFDSKTVPASTFKIYLLRTSTLESRGPGKFELAWKQIPRGNVKRAEDATPVFAEMAEPGSVFEGEWHQNAFLSQPEIGKALRRRASVDSGAMFELVNAYTEQLLKIQRQYAEWTGQALLKSTVEQLEARLDGDSRGQARVCAAARMGRGIFIEGCDPEHARRDVSRILRQVGLYARAIQSGLPFPKTRRIVFVGNQPASIPGFVHLEVIG